jgi:hypothetical protein
MTESDITFQLSELYDRWWAIHQWWLSVSFGLVAVAHFAGKKLSLLLTSIIVLLYAAFSVRLYGLVEYNERIMVGFIRDLSALDASGHLQSNGAAEYLRGMVERTGWPILGDIALFGTFASVVFYLSFTVIQNRKADKVH